jgi:maleylacetoacetate isomerase
MKCDLQLYNYFRSSASYRVRLGLHAKGLPFEYIPVHLIKNQGEQFSETYKGLNSLSQVPTLIHQSSAGSKVLSQSVAILEYVEEVFPEFPLLPNDPFLRAKIREFCETINSLAQPMGNLGTLQYLEKNHRFDSQMKTDWIHFWNIKALHHLEGLCQKFHGRFCFENQFTLAECFLLPQLFTARRFKVDLSAFPTLLKVEMNCKDLDFSQKAHPEKQIDFEP